jgi:hypothetical protein
MSKPHQDVAQNPDNLIHGPFPLPPELILEIIKHFGTGPEEYYAWGFAAVFQLFRARQEALRALSQTSRFLRSVCLPLLWEYLNVYYHRQGSVGIAAKLERMILGLTENPTLAAYVRSVISPFPCVMLCKHVICVGERPSIWWAILL